MELIITLVIGAIVIGVILMLMNLAPIDARIKQAVTIIIVAIFIIYCLKLLVGMDVRL